MRNIDDVLHFRHDLSPFLVHLTRRSGGTPAREVLGKILEQKRLQASFDAVSAARYADPGFQNLLPGKVKRFYCAICFTETPLSSIHCLLEIKKRERDLAPYGLVFVKNWLEWRGVAPVWYINNRDGDKSPVVQRLVGLRKTNPEVAEQILPLVSVFGKKVHPADTTQLPPGKSDWRWEREWRLPACNGPLIFDLDDVFVGLCPHEEIKDFEERFPVPFIDPLRNMQWYAAKLRRARKNAKLKHSVV